MKINNFRKILKKNKYVFFTYKKLTDQVYRSGLKTYKKSVHLKSKEKIKKEISLFKKYWNCDPMDYFRYRLFDKELSAEELLDYIPNYYFYNFYMPKIYDGIDLSVTNSKILMMNYLIGERIETPVALAIFKKGLIFDHLDHKLLFEDLVEKMLKVKTQIFFVKPDDGQGGKGIFIIRKSNNNLYIEDLKLDKNLLRLKTISNRFVLQEGIKQRSDFNRINPTSVNTLRVITQKINNVIRISAVVIRIGRNKSVVDNSSQGGISVKIDIEKGMLNSFGTTELTNERFEEHPDTHFKFDGFVIQGWDKIMSQVLEYANRISIFPELGWDIAVLENGISVIEINAYYGLELLQCCSGGMRRQLNVIPD
jgi:hypothetical protein